MAGVDGKAGSEFMDVGLEDTSIIMVHATRVRQR